MPNYYELLGVARSATGAEVRKAYLQLAKEKHPDRFADPAQKAEAQRFFQDLTTAFNTLNGEKSRREYDAEIERPRAVTPAEIAQEAYTRGLQMLEEGNLQDAVTSFHTAAHHAPGEGRYHAALGRALARHPPSARDAIQAFERAIHVSPNTASFHAELAALFLKQGLRLRAQKEVEAALRLDPRDSLARRVAEHLGPE